LRDISRRLGKDDAAMTRSPWTMALVFVQAIAFAAGAAREATAGIEARLLEGELVFTSRPERKPGVAPASPASMSLGRKGRPAPPAGIGRLVEEVSRRYAVDPGLVNTVIGVESGFNQRAVSPKGARGLMQLMPDTARQYGVRDAHDPRQNIEGGVAYLTDLLRQYGGDMKLALAAYNAGPEAVARASGVPNFAETRDYIRKIEDRYGRLTGEGVVSKDRPAAAPPRGGPIRAARDREGQVIMTNRTPSGSSVAARHRKVRR
jgi:soluble lytic murein transglycosylase-like protein